jgi:hypothetical protein
MSTEPIIEVPQVEGITGPQFQSMGEYLMQGMNESEAALLAGIGKTTILVMRKNSKEYNEFVERKQLEFKRKHLAVLGTKNDPKISQWLLERLTDDFSGKGKKDDVPQNVVASIIRDIQENNPDTSGLTIAYKDKVKNDGSNSQRSSRQEATDRIKSVLQ